MSQINAAYPNLVGGGGDGGGAEGEGKEEPREGDGAAPGGFAARWGWVACVDSVSETCRCPWEEVWKMNALEFLNVLAYAKDKAEKRKHDIEAWRRTH